MRFLFYFLPSFVFVRGTTMSSSSSAMAIPFLKLFVLSETNAKQNCYTLWKSANFSCLPNGKREQNCNKKKKNKKTLK